MEEDIKILEEYLKPRLNAKTHLGYEVVRYPELEAIDNLVKGYRELEAKVKRYEKYLDNKDKRFKEALENEYQERETDYIPKSKIKEILCRLNISDIEPWSTYKVNGEILFDLEKLLGE